MKIKFISLASGSSGNCYFLGTDRYGILVDAGIGIRTIKKTLKELGIGLDIIRAVFITHDHADHIKAVGHLGEKFGIPVYSTPEVHAGINKSYCMTENYRPAYTICTKVRQWNWKISRLQLLKFLTTELTM